MQWVAFAILVYLVAVLQATLAPFLAIHTIQPNLLVIVAVYYALAARTYDALMACWIIGLVIDLTSLSYHGASNVGLGALTLAVVGIATVKVREFVLRDRVASHVVMTCVGSLVLSLATGLYMRSMAGADVRLSNIVAVSMYTALYTGVVAPYGHWFLRKLRGLLGIGPSHHMRAHGEA